MLGDDYAAAGDTARLGDSLLMFCDQVDAEVVDECAGVIAYAYVCRPVVVVGYVVCPTVKVRCVEALCYDVRLVDGI